MATSSEMFFIKTEKKSVYNIQSIDNIPSVIQYGLLSFNHASKINHRSIAMSDVQNLRDNVIIPNGNSLHSYASAYFDPRNPMMYKRKNIAQTLCVLAIKTNVLDFEGTIISDGNAASEYSRFYSPLEGIDRLDFNLIYSQWWTDDDLYEKARRKRIKCAEILVPGKIDYEYIVGAIVVNEQAKLALEDKGFQKKIVVSPNVFFWKEVVR